MALVFAVMHLYSIFFFFIASVHSFFILFKNLVLINQWNGPRYQRVLALCAFFNRGNTEVTNSLTILCFTFVYVLLYLCKFGSGLI